MVLFITIYVDDHYYDEIEIYFNDTTKFIDSINGHVMIHCWAGISRSASIVIAYLINKHKMSYDIAFKHVQSKRSFIYPNEGFVRQLKSFAESND